MNRFVWTIGLITISFTDVPAWAEELLPYRVVEKQDLSYPGKSRMTYRVVFDVEKFPDKIVLKETANKVWQKSGKGFDEFTVFGYLPEMDTENVAYVVANFTPKGLQEFKVNDISAYGTKWWDVVSSKAEKGNTQAKDVDVVQYNAELIVKKEGRTLQISLKSDFPENTLVLVSVTRSFWEKGKNDTYSGDIHSKDIPIKDGIIEVTVNVDDKPWYKQRKQKEEQFKGLGVFGEIGKISPEVEVRTMVSPRRQKSKHIEKLFGKNGERIGGKGAQKGAITTYELEKAISIKFNGK